MNKIFEFLEFQLQGFGFENRGDFSHSVFYYKAALVSLPFGTAAFFIEKFLGLTPLAYGAFLVLVVGEFITGLLASNAGGVKIRSRKIGRMIIKMSIYTLFIGVLNIFSEEINVPEFFNYEVNIYKFIYYIVLNLVIIQLIISVLENLSKLGFAETSKIFSVIKQFLNKWFDLKPHEGDKD